MNEPTIYIVEDDSSVRKSLSRLLRTIGHPVEVFASAEEFLQDTTNKQGCLMADVRMPGISGLALQTKIKERSLPIGVVLMTGHGSEDVQAQAVRAGAQFLLKPFDESAILQAIKVAMESITP